MKKLFQYTVLFHKYEKTESGANVYKDSELIIEPKYILAETENEVIFKATREIGEKYAKAPDNIEILVRNF